MNASESSEGFLGFLSGGQLWRHILVAQRILPRATQNSVFFANIEHRVLADVLLKNFVAAADVLLFVAAAVFSVGYFSMLLKNFVAAYQSLREACAISGPCIFNNMMLFKRSFGLTRSLFILYVHEHDRLGFGM